MEFDNGIGMLVHGELDVFGSTTDKAAFTVNLTNIIANNETNVRLVDGANGFEGRLEVNIEGEWGTVCNEVSAFTFAWLSVSVIEEMCDDCCIPG